jgi:CRISPR/Cas system-associated protein Csm6
MNKAVRVDFLFNPVKVNPLSHTVRYCGFLYDTETHPTLRILEDKWDRALAMLDYILFRKNTDLSKLSLSVICGTLQSMVVATLSRISQTFLREAYNNLYKGTEADAPEDARW